MTPLRTFAATVLVALAASSCASTPAPRLPVLRDTTGPVLPRQGVAQRYGPKKGESEVRVGGSFAYQEQSTTGSEDSTATVLSTQLGLGWLLGNDGGLELGGQLLLSRIKTDTGGGGENSESTAGTLGFYPYLRNNKRIGDRAWTYIGIHAGVLSLYFNDETFNSFSYGAHVGMKIWVTPDVSFFFEPRVTRTTIEIQDVDQDLLDITTIVGLAFTF